jgi:hypothetical protein
MNTWWSDDTIPLPTECHGVPGAAARGRNAGAPLRRRGAAAALRSSTGEFQILDLVPRQVMESLPSFNALIEVALGRCLNS